VPQRLRPFGPGSLPDVLAFHYLGQSVLDEEFYVWHYSMEI
jgi:hypothetical protein